MCGRFTHMYTWKDLHRLYSLTTVPATELAPDFNVAPTRQVPIVRTKDGQREGTLVRWGLVPFFAKGEPPKYSTINATIEKIEAGPSWRGPWKRGQRCILPASGFYEWHVNEDATKTPYYITIVDQPVFGFAGLWDASKTDAGQVVESATIITMPPNKLMAEIHNAKQRMPAILAAANVGAWLEGSSDEARAALKQFPAAEMLAWPVSTRVNAPKNNAPELLEKV